MIRYANDLLCLISIFMNINENVKAIVEKNIKKH